MWSQINDEFQSLKNQINKNIPLLGQVSSKVRELLNRGPGLFHNVHRQCKRVYPKNYSGINVSANKFINDQIGYNFNISVSPSDSYYAPYNAYLGREVQKYSNEQSQIGSSCLAFQQRLTDELICSIFGHIKHINTGSIECVLDYYGKNFTSSAALCNENVSKAEILLQHLHEINKDLVVGAELGLQTSNDLVINSKRTSIVARFHEKKTDCTVSGTLSNQGLQFCLYKQIDPKVRIGTILDVCLHTKTIIGSLACELVEKDIRVKTSVDSKGVFVFNVSTDNFYSNENIYFRPTLSALFNIQKHFDLGIGFEIFI